MRKFEKLDDVPELHDKVKNIIKQAFSKLEAKYELFSITHSAVESKSGPGFISQNDGGAFSAGYSTVKSLSQGHIQSLPQEAKEKIEELEKTCLEFALDQFKGEYKSELEELNLSDEDLNYSSLQEKGHQELADALSGMEDDHTSDNEATIRFVLAASLARESSNNQERTMYVDVVVNWEAPYHRAGKNNEWYIQESFDFKDEDSMLSQLQAKMNEYISKVILS